MSITYSADTADGFDFAVLSALDFLGSFALGLAFFRCFGVFPTSSSPSAAFRLVGFAGVADLSLSLGVFFFTTFGVGLVARPWTLLRMSPCVATSTSSSGTSSTAVRLVVLVFDWCFASQQL